MDLLNTVANYLEENEDGERAVFEAAMQERLATKGYKMSDLLYDLYVCQRQQIVLKKDFIELQNLVNSLKMSAVRKGNK